MASWMRGGLVLVLFAAAGCAGAARSGEGDPLQWGDPVASELDFLVGEVDRAAIRFPFRNAANRPIRFLEGKTDCKCTSISLPKGEVAPGATGELEILIEVSDGEDRVVVSRNLVTYSCGGRRYGHVLDAGLNKRRLAEAQPAVLELTPAADDPAEGSCAGTVVLVQYTKPGREFAELTNWNVEGDVFVARDGGWGRPERDGGFLRRSRAVEFRTKASAADVTGTARLSALCGERRPAALRVPIRWARPELVTLEPKTVVLAGDRPTCEVVVSGKAGRPTLRAWELPAGVQVDHVASGGPGPNRLVTTLRLVGRAAEGRRPRTEPFRVTVECAGKEVRLGGTMLIL
jgi:hypothetical protein